MEDPSLQQILVPFAFMVALLVLFWLVVVRPTHMRQKKHLDLVRSLMPGDGIITVGGIHGTVRKVNDSLIEVEIAPNTVVTLDRRAVRRLQGQEDF